MKKKTKNKYEKPINIDVDLTFEQAMVTIAHAPKEEVEKSILKEEKKRK